MKLTKSLLFLLSLLLFAASCDSEEPEDENEEEVITTLNFTLTGNGETVTMTFSDLDGEGGNDPIITGGTLTANSTYSGSLELLNESEDPSEDITEEIKEEDAEHQFFFATTVAGLTVAYSDTDGDGNPVGLATSVSTGDAGSGNLTVTLRHEPNKSGAGVSDGDISNAGGETDIEVTFDVNVQ